MNEPQTLPQPSESATTEAGFSLIEVMVALFVFALISTGTAYTVLNVMQLNRDSRARHVAVNLAAQEIDLARDTADLLSLVDVMRPTQIVGSDTFHVVVTTAWVSATGTDDACGATNGTLLYKRVNVEVRWDNQRAGTSPVRADTVVTPNSHLNAPDRGTILVRVLGASGSGVSGVSITAGPAAVANGARSTGSATTDAQGCAFLARLTPGNYNVTASAAGHIDSLTQATAPVVTVPLVAGYSAGASFSYDRATTFTLDYAPTAAAAPGGSTPPAAPAPAVPAPSATVFLPQNLDTSYVTADGVATVTSRSASGSATSTTRTGTAALFPFAAGYAVMAGRYAAAEPAGGAATASCLSVDPAAWAPATEAGVALTGTRIIAAGRPGEVVAAAVPVRIGLLTVSGLAAGSTLTAVSATAPAGSGDPGCARATTYTFGQVPAGSTIALPFGSWTLHSGAATVPAAAITLNSRGTQTGTTVTLDPRTVAP